MSKSIIQREDEQGNIKSTVVRGAVKCGSLTCFLVIERSAWFQVNPLPDDEYRIRYKAEHHEAVLAYCNPGPSAEEILAEFMGDVEAAGAEEVEKEWCDLYVTYLKARNLLANP